MIAITLTYIQDILKEHFRNEFRTPDKAVLSNIVKADGSGAQNVDGKIVFFLVSLDDESTLKNSLSRSSNQDNSSFIQKSPNLHLNLQLLFCANFDSSLYVEGLSYLSSLIRFFQAHKILELDPPNNSHANKIRLSFELCKLDYAQLSHLWSAIGSKLMPSVLYQVRLVTFDELPVERMTPLIKETATQT
ncbi:MAG TPA: hypothetical protein DCR40_05865 [Prolixibacteraceae bacterium]|nr:hypothetical protein [Prolixibacteraceae bacterium]